MTPAGSKDDTHNPCATPQPFQRLKSARYFSASIHFLKIKRQMRVLTAWTVRFDVYDSKLPHIQMPTSLWFPPPAENKLCSPGVSTFFLTSRHVSVTTLIPKSAASISARKSVNLPVLQMFCKIFNGRDRPMNSQFCSTSFVG